MPEILDGLVGDQFVDYVFYGSAAAALLIVLWMLRFWLRRAPRRVFAGPRTQQQRLAIVDAAVIDEHRRIVLVRRDDVEHLLMIGGYNDLVVERDIGKPMPVAVATTPMVAAEPAVSAPVVAAPPQTESHVTAPATAEKPTPAKDAPRRSLGWSGRKAADNKPAAVAAVAAAAPAVTTAAESPARAEPVVEMPPMQDDWQSGEADSQTPVAEEASLSETAAAEPAPAEPAPLDQQADEPEPIAPKSAEPKEGGMDDKTLENEMEKLLGELVSDK